VANVGCDSGRIEARRIDVKPAPGRTMLAAKAPISNASVERTSKYSSALTPTRPTFFRSLMPPMPATTVQKMTKPMTILIIFRNTSPSGPNAVPVCGASQPTATPATIPNSTCP
jgi:hypothetical protein